MATEAPKKEVEWISESELDETSVLSSLARLQLMHASLRQLRETIPRIMDSVLIDSPAPDELHAYFSQATMGAAKDIKSFAQLMEESKSKEVLQKAKESRANDAEGITAWRVSEHADWLDVKIDAASDDLDMDADIEDMDTAPADFVVENMQASVERFSETHGGIEAMLDGDTKTIKLFLPSPAHIHFEIQMKTTVEGQSDYNVESMEKTKLHRKVIEAITPRSNSMRLDNLLDMLVAYKDIKSRACVKCSRLLDPDAQFPVVRSKKRTKQADGQYVIHWEALHLSCI